MTTDLYRLIGYIQDDLRNVQAKLVEARAQLAALNLPDPTATTCPHCQLEVKPPTSLADHLHVTHGQT